jgi:DNA/RNA endonuclease G (NUC1)
MKKIFLSIVTLTFLTLSSCVSDNETFNDDIKKSYDVSAESLLSNAQKELVDQLTTPVLIITHYVIMFNIGLQLYTLRNQDIT